MRNTSNATAAEDGVKSTNGLPGLESFRKRAGLTQENLARKMGITLGHLWKIARGHRNASTELIERLCEVLTCTPNDLMGWSEGKAAS